MIGPDRARVIAAASSCCHAVFITTSRTPSLFVPGWKEANTDFLLFCGGPETPARSIGCSANIAQALAKEYGEHGSQGPSHPRPAALSRPAAAAVPRDACAVPPRPERCGWGRGCCRIARGSPPLPPLPPQSLRVPLRNAADCPAAHSSAYGRRVEPTGRSTSPHNILISLSRTDDELPPSAPQARPSVGRAGSWAVSES